MIVQRLKDGRVRDKQTGRVLKDAPDVRTELEKIFQNIKLNDKFISRKINPWDKFGNESKKWSSSALFRLQKAGSLYLNGDKKEAASHFKAVIENSKNVVSFLKKGLSYLREKEPSHYSDQDQKNYMDSIKRFDDQVKNISALFGRL